MPPPPPGVLTEQPYRRTHSEGEWKTFNDWRCVSSLYNYAAYDLHCALCTIKLISIILDELAKLLFPAYISALMTVLINCFQLKDQLNFLFNCAKLMNCHICCAERIDSIIRVFALRLTNSLCIKAQFAAQSTVRRNLICRHLAVKFSSGCTKGWRQKTGIREFSLIVEHTVLT